MQVNGRDTRREKGDMCQEEGKGTRWERGGGLGRGNMKRKQKVTAVGRSVEGRRQSRVLSGAGASPRAGRRGCVCSRVMVAAVLSFLHSILNYYERAIVDGKNDGPDLDLGKTVMQKGWHEQFFESTERVLSSSQ